MRGALALLLLQCQLELAEHVGPLRLHRHDQAEQVAAQLDQQPAIGRAFSAAVADVGKPYWIEFRFEPVVFVFLAVLCAGCAIVFGMAPALRLSRVDLIGSLKEGERGSGGSLRTRWFTGAMVTAQIGLAMVLLVGAASALIMAGFGVVYFRSRERLFADVA